MWQVQYFRVVFRRCAAVFVTGAALWTCPSSFCVAGAALWTCRAACFLRVALSGLRQVAARCKFRGRPGILRDVMKIDGSFARNIDFEVANFGAHQKIGRKTSILKLQSMKIGGCLARNARFDAPTCLVSGLWFSCGLAVSMGEAAKPILFILFQGVKSSCSVVLRGRPGAS